MTGLARLALKIFIGAAAGLGGALILLALADERAARRAAEDRITRSLEQAPALYRAYLDSQAAARQGQVRSAARESGLPSCLAQSGAARGTYHDKAMELTAHLEADSVVLFDAQGTLLARADRRAPEEGTPARSQDWWTRTRKDLTVAPASFLEASGSGRVDVVASTPLLEPERARVVGVVAAAFPLDEARVAEVASLASADAALLVHASPVSGTSGMHLAAATPGLHDLTLPYTVRPTEVGVASPAQTEEESLVEVTSRGRRFIAAALPVRSADGAPIATLLLARSPDAAWDDLHAVRRSLVGVGSLLLLLLLPLSWILAAAFARPLRRLARVAEDVGRGQLDVEVPALRGEAGLLARAMASMVTELKAKAELEAVAAGDRGRPTGDPSAPQAQHEGGSLVQGTLAGRYEVRSVLGEGGMGTVYRVRDRELDDEVALKVLKPVSDESDAATPSTNGPTGELLRQEIKLARMVTHANVVRVHDFGEAEGLRYFTMEYVPGTTLRELLARGSILDLLPTLQIAKQICRGLAAVHRSGIVHGDLKPQNVVVMGNGVVKLMDFGVARTRSALARGEPLAGTPAYMSPEQARGAELDERSDLYSAGVLFFELFTGRCPFVGDDPYETLRMHLNEPPPDPRRLRSDMPDALAQIIVTCLAKSPFRRPPSAADLERLLMRVRP